MSFLKSEIFEEEGLVAVELLESLGTEAARPGEDALSLEEIVLGFLENTGGLSASEQAELLGGVLQNQRAETTTSAPTRSGTPSRTSSPVRSSPTPSRAPSRPSGSTGTTGRATSPATRGGAAASSRRQGSGFDFGQLMGGVQQGLSIATQGAQTLGALSSLFRGGGSAGAQAPAQDAGYAPPAAAYAPQYASAPQYAPASQPEPGSAAQLLARFDGGPAQVQQQGFSQIAALLQALQQGQTPALPGAPIQAPVSASPAPAGAFDATALLRLLLGNPQLQQALSTTAVLGGSAPREVVLPLPAATAGGGSTAMPIPLGAVVNAISALAGRSLAELNASTREGEPELPEYLVSESGDLLVDPSDAEQRAALVVNYFRLAAEAERVGWFEEPDEGLSEAELWERDAGFHERTTFQ